MAAADAFQNLFFNQAGQAGQKGQGSLDQITKYFSTLLSGDRSGLLKAVQPEANAARAGADAAKKEQAEKGTARTGGTAAGNQSIEDEVRKQIDTLLGQMQQNAAAGLKGVSDSELQTMMSAIGPAQSDINARRQAATELWSSLLGGAAKIGAAFI